MKIIETKNAPAAIGPYSQGVLAGDLVYTSGQIPLVPESGILAESRSRQSRQYKICPQF